MRKHPPLRVQFALLVHLYRVEILELSSQCGKWLADLAQELALCVRDIACYSTSSRRLR